jgi:hypothetical protein
MKSFLQLGKPYTFHHHHATKGHGFWREQSLQDDLTELRQLECPASFVPVELIQTGIKGAECGTREKA